MIGWECPKCGKCYNPTTLACLWCGPTATVSVTCSLRVLAEQGRKPLSASKTSSPQMPAESDAQPVTVEFS